MKGVLSLEGIFKVKLPKPIQLIMNIMSCQLTVLLQTCKDNIIHTHDLWNWVVLGRSISLCISDVAMKTVTNGDTTVNLTFYLSKHVLQYLLFSFYFVLRGLQYSPRLNHVTRSAPRDYTNLETNLPSTLTNNVCF